MNQTATNFCLESENAYSGGNRYIDFESGFRMTTQLSSANLHITGNAFDKTHSTPDLIKAGMIKG